jgi:hypothetical protein
MNRRLPARRPIAPTVPEPRSPGRAGAARLLAGSACLAAMLCVAACAPRDRSAPATVRAASGLPKSDPVDDPDADPVTPIESRIHAVYGRTLVIPVRVRGRFEFADALQVRLDDKRAIPSRLFRVSVNNTADGGWLPAPGQWTVELASKPASDKAGFSVHVVVASLPFDAVGQGLWLEQHRIALNWLPEPPMLAAELKLTADAVRWPEASPFSGEPSVRDLIESERISPLRRWRYRLVKGSLGAATQAEPLPPEVLVDAFPDPVLEAWARQREDRWIVGLKKLRSVDPALADRLVESLRLIARFPGDVAAPIWNTDQGELEELVQTLLNPDLADKARLARVTEWLDARPRASAWVIDDAGAPDVATGQATPTIAMLNLTRSSALGFVALRGRPSAQEMTAIEPLRTSVLSIRDQDPIADGPAGPTPVVIHIGDWSRPAAIADRPVPAPSSGVRLGPFVPDWTCGDLLAGVQPPPDAAGLTAALLFRSPGQASPDAWTLYVECHAGDGAVSEEDRLSVFLGPLGPGAEAITVSPDGAVVPGGYAKDVSVVTENGRWVVQLKIPSDLIESDGTLRLAMTRSDRRGRRWAYPRPMLPWEDQPGRVAIATRAPGAPARPGPAPTGGIR